MGGSQQISRHSSHSDRSHKQTLASLPGYATAMALGQAPENQYSAVADHLRTCSACRAQLDELLALVRPAYNAQLAPAAHVPRFDLSFLGGAAQRVEKAGPSWFVDSLQRFVVAFSDALLASMRQSAYAQPVRGAALYHYVPEPPPDMLGITIDVFANDDDPRLGNVQVVLDIPSRDPFDQAGTNVSLRLGELVWQATTNATGSAAFTGVPLSALAQLRVEVALPAV